MDRIIFWLACKLPTNWIDDGELAELSLDMNEYTEYLFQTLQPWATRHIVVQHPFLDSNRLRRLEATAMRIRQSYAGVNLEAVDGFIEYLRAALQALAAYQIETGLGDTDY
jgi:hypothetical protein